MRLATMALPLMAACSAPAAYAADLSGPARFCGYSPIIDLESGETITTMESGIHAGTFRWDGNFGSLKVTGIGWASRPRGRIVVDQTDEKPARFQEFFSEGEFVVAIWNGAQGVAYFTSDRPMTQPQMQAIDRVRLYQEGETPEGCDLRTVFVWE